MKETLQQRTSVLEEHQAAVKTTITKRRHIERLKASSNIRPDRVDEALEEMEEVITPLIQIVFCLLTAFVRRINTSNYLPEGWTVSPRISTERCIDTPVFLKRT